MITTPGELHVGMVFTVIEGKPVVEQENWQERELVMLSDILYPKRESSLIPGLGRPYVVRAIQLPMILAQHLTDQKPAVFDSRTLVFRELDKKYVREYLRLFSVNTANPKTRTRKKVQ